MLRSSTIYYWDRHSFLQQNHLNQTLNFQTKTIPTLLLEGHIAYGTLISQQNVKYVATSLLHLLTTFIVM